MLDVLIVGAGMSGLTAAFAMMMHAVRNIRVVDRAPAGREGPWVTFARMPTLRSSKKLPGLGIGIPSLTFHAWYESRFGRDAWDRLDKAPNRIWMDYLDWFREVLAIPVENDVEVLKVEPAPGWVRVVMRSAAGEEIVHARHVVLATGMGGGGQIFVPGQISRGLWPDLAAHTSGDIDFEVLKGKSVVVIGGGTSAWDNAATALEHGAARVDMLLRRKELPQVNKGRGSGYPAFVAGLPGLTDRDRWRFFVYQQRTQVPPPPETVMRTIRHDGFRVRFDSALEAAGRSGDNRVAIKLAGTSEVEHFDFLISGTGFMAGIEGAREIGHLADVAETWRDRLPDPSDPDVQWLGGAPYVTPHYAMTERTPGACPGIERIRLYSHVANVSHGPVAGGIPPSPGPAELLTRGLITSLMQEDVEQIWERLVAFNEPELVGTPFLTSTP
jgi:cation diffusion facilitator CzcD-associated flavoprotein CzcO